MAGATSAIPRGAGAVALLADDGVDWAVLTTKGIRFTAELLDGFDLHPWRVVWPGGWCQA